MNTTDIGAAPTPRNGFGRVVAALGLVAGPLVLVAGLATSPAAAEPIDASAINGGYTIVTFGDATLGNVEIEGSLAIGGDVRFTRGYPIVHSTGLTPRDYALPVVDGDPTRLLVGGRFDVDGSSGTSEVTSAGRIDDATQLGYVKIEDRSNLAVNGRGAGDRGIWLSRAGTSSGDNPALHVPDVVNQPRASLAADGAFAATFGGAQAAAADLAGRLTECTAAAEVALQPGSHGGERRLTLTAGVTNVLNVTPAELGSYRIAFVGAEPNATTPLVVNVIGASGSVTLPGFAAVTSPSAANPNPFASHVFWNFGTTTGSLQVRGDLVSGTLFAPMAALSTDVNSPIEGQIVSNTLVTAGGEIHHYGFDGTFECGDTEETTTSSTSSSTTPTTESTTTEPTTTEPEETTTSSTSTTPTTSSTSTTSTTEPTTEPTTTEPEETTTTSEVIATTVTSQPEATTTTDVGGSTSTSTIPTAVGGDEVTSSTAEPAASAGGHGTGGAAAAATTTGAGSELARTGSDSPQRLLLIGAGLLLFGGGALLARRELAR